MKFRLKQGGRDVEVVGPIEKARSYAVSGPKLFIEQGEAYAGRIATVHRGEFIVTLADGHRYAATAAHLAKNFPDLQAIPEEPVKPVEVAPAPVAPVKAVEPPKAAAVKPAAPKAGKR